MEFSRPEYWSGLPFPSPEDLPNPGIEPRSPTLQADAVSAEPQGKPFRSYQFSSVAQSFLTLCNPMDCSTSGFPLHHQLPEFTQTHVHRVSDAIQPSYLLSSPSPAFNLSQHLGLFNESVLHIRWPKYGVSALASVLSMNIQDWFPLGWTGWISFQSKGLSSLLQHHSSKASILQSSAFFMVQLTSIYDYWTNHLSHAYGPAPGHNPTLTP